MSWGRSNRLSRSFDPAVPVVVAGGKRLDSVRDALALVSDAVTVVHHGHGVDDALGLYERLAGRPVPAGR